MTVISAVTGALTGSWTDASARTCTYTYLKPLAGAEIYKLGQKWVAKNLPLQLTVGWSHRHVFRGFSAGLDRIGRAR